MSRGFICTYALSWFIWIPLALSHLRMGPFTIPDRTRYLVRLLGVLGPAIVADWAVALIILWHWGPETMVRKPQLADTPP